MLLIARLDRLARNVAFIANLMESGADFIACDMPQATRLTIHILAAVANHEREMISARTKAALAEAKRRGTLLGNPRIAEATAKAHAAHRASPASGGNNGAHRRMEAAGMDVAPYRRRVEPAKYPPGTRSTMVCQQRKKSACDGAGTPKNLRAV